ncbi:MAG: RICIN domain-containing protein [Opitutaceae bacterium]
MIFKNLYRNTIATLLLGAALSTAEAGLDDYTNPDYYDQFNPEPASFNSQSWQVGFDSSGNDNPNALQWSATIEVEETYLYDNYGNKLKEDGVEVITEAGPIGYYDGEHYGKVHAGAWAKIKINGTERDCIYLAAAHIQGGGTYSGWARVDKASPEDKLTSYSQTIYDRRESVRYTANPGGSSRYVEHTILDTSVPAALEDSYILPDRTSNAGKAKYYYIRDGVLNGFINLPETGNKRHGVQASRVKVGKSFWRDVDVDDYIQNLYGYDSSTVAGTFRWSFGYFETNTGQKIYCWTNRDCLDNPSTTVMIRKRNSLGYALDGSGQSSNGQNVYLWGYNSNNANQQWVEIDQGNGYYSYQKLGTNYSLDGGNGGANNQNVYLWKSNNNNYNQHWQKVDMGGGYIQLRKRNSTGFGINGGSGGANGQNVNLYNSGHSSHNLQWQVEYK